MEISQNAVYVSYIMPTVATTKHPPMSQLVAMAKCIQEAEQVVTAMSASTGRCSSNSITPHRDSNPVDIAQHSTPQPPPFELPQAAIARVLSPREANQTEDVLAIARSWEGRTSVSGQVDGPTLKDSTAPELTLDEHGSIHYYGPISVVHEPSPTIPKLLQRIGTDRSSASSNSQAPIYTLDMGRFYVSLDTSLRSHSYVMLRPSGSHSVIILSPVSG
jgi:hypothetical protein